MFVKKFTTDVEMSRFNIVHLLIVDYEWMINFLLWLIVDLHLNDFYCDWLTVNYSWCVVDENILYPVTKITAHFQKTRTLNCIYY